MQKTYNIIGIFKYAIILPIVVIITGIFFNIFVGADLAIEFRGGTAITYSYEGEIDYDKVKNTAENSLKEVNSETVLNYSYSGTLDDSAVTSTLSQENIEGITFSAETGTNEGESFIEISAVGNTFLTEAQITEISSTLTSNYSSNSLVLKSKVENSYKDVKLEVTSSASLSSGAESIRINAIGNVALTTTQLEKIKDSLVEDYADNKIDQVEVNSVSESFGSAFFQKAIFAVVLASVLVILYVGYRFRKVGGLRAGITALVALVHDVLFIYFVDVIFGITIDTNFIAVFLTILGYSLNDTIVIYDRIRENSAIYGNKKTIRELANLSISQSMKRTCVTSLTTFLAIMSVTVVAAIYGLDSILTFSIPMSIGTIVGTLSSLFIAGPLYVFWCEHNEKKAGKDKSIKSGSSKTVKYTNRINSKNKRKRTY